MIKKVLNAPRWILAIMFLVAGLGFAAIFLMCFFVGSFLANDENLNESIRGIKK